MKRKTALIFIILMILILPVNTVFAANISSNIESIATLQNWILQKESVSDSDFLKKYDIDKNGIVNVVDLAIIKGKYKSENESIEYQSISKTTNIGTYDFNGFQYAYGGTSLPFRETIIGNKNSNDTKLVIYLHGGHSCGTDNSTQLEDTSLLNIADYLKKNNMNAVLVAPQCNSDHLWTYKPNKQLLKSFIDEKIASGEVSENQIYMLGASAGGSGTWNMVSDYPDLFNAAMPSVSSPQGLSYEALSKTPLCVVLGENDVMFPPEEVKPLLDEITANGGEILYQVREGCKHPEACQTAFSDECLEWVLNR